MSLNYLMQLSFYLSKFATWPYVTLFPLEKSIFLDTGHAEHTWPRLLQ